MLMYIYTRIYVYILCLIFNWEAGFRPSCNLLTEIPESGPPPRLDEVLRFRSMHDKAVRGGPWALRGLTGNLPGIPGDSRGALKVLGWSLGDPCASIGFFVSASNRSVIYTVCFLNVPLSPPKLQSQL